MATTKKIQPTGTTITIPAMTDRPDASVFSTDVDRITDATNALNSNIMKGVFVADEHYVGANDSTSYTLSNEHEIGFIFANNGNGIEHIYAYGVRNSTEIGITRLSPESSYINVTTSGLTITIACTYNTRVQIVRGKAIQ